MKGFLRSRFMKRFLRHRLAVVGSSIILLLIFTALLGGRLAPTTRWRSISRRA